MKKNILIILIISLSSLQSFAQEKTKDNWIIKWNSTAAIDAFSFPTVQFAVEKKINPYFSVQLESGIQIYDFRKVDTTIVNTNGFKLMTEGRFYLFNYLNKEKSSARKSGGFYTGIQFFYRKNDYNFKQDYFLNETDYENYTNLQSDIFGVKKEVFGANISLGYQIPFKRIIFEPYMYLGTLNRKIKNISREYNTNLGHISKDEIHYRGMDLYEESNNTFNFSFGFRIGYKL